MLVSNLLSSYSAFSLSGIDMDHLAQVFRRPRQTQRATEDPTAHPLLHETPSPNPPQPHSHSRSARRRNGGGPDDGYNALVTTLEELVGPEGIQLLEQLINRAREGGVIDIGGAAIAGLGRDRLHPPPRHVIAAPWTTRSEEPPRDPMAEAHDFNPVHTLQRWADEVKMTQGKLVAEMISKLQNHFVLALLPAAREEARLAKEKEEKDAAVREEARAEEARLEEARKAEEEERANAAAAAQAAAELQDVVMAEPSSENAHPVPDAPISEAQEAPPAEQQPSSSSESTGVPEVTQAADDATPVASSSGTASAPVTRITVLVNGSPVDITDTGIDPTFLEALPDDMREEVLNQHFRERRAAARPERTHESQISPEFLDALPPEIRDEILQQEGIDQLRRARDQAAQQAGENAPGVPSDIDPASFLASLDPQLRQAVLLEQEEGFINTLPSNLVAEANVLRQGSARRIFSSRVVGVPPNGQGAPVLAARKPPIQRDSIQLLDKTGIATLVRLLFFPHVLRKNSLHKILVNLSVNPKSRSELFNFLLAILQDGTGDLAAVDKSFSQMSFRNKPLATPKATPKSKVASTSVDVGLLSHVPSESVPHLVAQRCLEALTYIVSANEQSSLFFLTENEVPSGLKRSSSKKGKGKEKQTAATHYPIVLLLSLLDREALLKVPSMMSAVVSLLSTVTKPLKDDASSPAEPSQAPPGRESAPALPASTPGPANTGKFPVPLSDELSPLLIFGFNSDPHSCRSVRDHTVTTRSDTTYRCSEAALPPSPDSSPYAPAHC
jgi:E3 ubiquitin-protein ligase HUWE1